MQPAHKGIADKHPTLPRRINAIVEVDDKYLVLIKLYTSEKRPACTTRAGGALVHIYSEKLSC